MCTELNAEVSIRYGVKFIGVRVMVGQEVHVELLCIVPDDVLIGVGKRGVSAFPCLIIIRG